MSTPPPQFPSPFSIATPKGGRGWQEMYPHHALFAEERREADSNRLWFRDSMHFPVPMPAFDVVAVDGLCLGVGAWQNRAFAIPPAMGIDYRVLNGYVYLSANPVTDPEKVAERAELFRRRAGHHYANWDELYRRWRSKTDALIAEIVALEVPDLPEYEPDEVVFGDRTTSCYGVLDAYSRALRLHELSWQHHFEFLLLGYGAYLTFAEFVKGALPDIPDRHVAQMIAGPDVSLSRADAELRRLARRAVDGAVADAFVEGRPPAEIEAQLGATDSGRAWLAELEKIKDPWFNMATGDGLQHHYRSWFDDPSIAYASITGHIQAIRDGRHLERPAEEIARERDRLGEAYADLLDDQARQTFRELLALARTVFPYVEGHRFFCDSWFLTRFWNKIREFGALLARHGYLADAEDVFQLTRQEVSQALEELCLMWASGGNALGPSHWPPIVARRKELLKRLEAWSPPPVLGTLHEVVGDPMTVMLWGITPERLRRWASADEAGADDVLSGSPASPGTVEGPARVVVGIDELSSVREGDVLVCPMTSPAWAPIFSKIRAAVTDLGGIMSHAGSVGREYGMPAVVGTGRATSEIRSGQTVRVDGDAGTVTIVRSVESS